MENYYYCDNCGEETKTETMFHYGSCPVDTASTRAGESASLCPACNEGVA